jgi:hypothetical protein
MFANNSIVRILHRFLKLIEMSTEEDFLYDDEEAVKFIKDSLPEELKDKFSDDDITYIVDLIYDFYDSSGLLDGNDDDREIEINEEEAISYVVKNALSDGVGKYDANDISLIVKGEMDYCESKGMFDLK